MANKNPVPFQGSLQKKKYFEGWYFKHVSSGGERILSLIPGIALSDRNPHAFIQVIDGNSGETFYLEYPVSDFHADTDRLHVRVGESVFTDTYCDILIDRKEFYLRGTLRYENMVSYPRTSFLPGIMGWFSHIPGMECRHDVVSLSHDIQGILKGTGGRTYDFSGGTGYIEKDWGRSFPDPYVWVQCNHFLEEQASFLLAAARIPLGGFTFPGFLGFLHHRGETVVFATWNRWSLRNLDFGSDRGNTAVLAGGGKTLSLRVFPEQYGQLKAPDLGHMGRMVKESVNSRIELLLEEPGAPPLRLSGSSAGFELHGTMTMP